MGEEDEYYWDSRPSSYIRERKRYAKDGEHIPNKNEAKLLRKLMSDTGLSEEQLRSHKTYRVMLSNAQKVKPKLGQRAKAVRDVTKKITKRLKLAKEHPLVQAEFKKEWDRLYGSGSRRFKIWKS